MYPAITLHITLLQHYPGRKRLYNILKLLHTLQQDIARAMDGCKHQLQQKLWKATSKSYGWLQASTTLK